MSSFEHTVMINRPIEEVFAFAADPAKDPLWQTSIVEIRRDTEGPIEVGSRVTEVRHFLGRRIETTWEVIDYDPPKTSAIKTISGPVPFSGRYSFEPVDGGTRMTFSFETDASGFFKLAEPVMARMIRREIESNSGHLKDLLEADADRSLEDGTAGE